MERAMKTPALLAALAALAFAAPAGAQESGGVPLAPGAIGGPVGLARPLPFVQTFITAHDVQGGMSAASRQSLHQNMITRLRGDPGYLAGFSGGMPLAPSRQPPPPDPEFFDFPGGGGGHHHHRQPIIINQGPVAIAVGDGNVIQQQSASGPGPIAQQQVATLPGGKTIGGGAVNVVTGSGNIIQQAPGAH
jgi:hypothetical protein